MATRVVIAATQPEIIRAIKIDLGKLNFIESVVQVPRVVDIESKLTKNCFNVALVDLDTCIDFARLPAIKLRNQLHVMCMSIRGASATVSLRGGGDEFILKPAISSTTATQRFSDNVVKNVLACVQKYKAPPMRELVKMVGKHDRQKIVAIASSTGGTNALEALLKGLPEDIPPTVVVQHMSSGFTKLFAERLNASYGQHVKEAASGDYLMRGTLLLAPADRHMKLVRREGRLAVECFVGPKMHGVMPAADILFESVAELVKAEAVGVVLTGMGADGARGLKLMRAAGAKTIGQDEATCVVYGMPKVAKDLGAIDFELPLDRIAEKIMALAK